jgi:formate-dependent nitrite reductase cytochrome c552 subunit
MGSENGKWLRPAKGRKMILASYSRTADETIYHIAFQLRKTAYAGTHSEEMTKVLNALKESGFIADFEVTEKSSPI